MTSQIVADMAPCAVEAPSLPAVAESVSLREDVAATAVTETSSLEPAVAYVCQELDEYVLFHYYYCYYYYYYYFIIIPAVMY